MAFLFMPLPRTATSSNCSTNVLLNTSLQATSCTATTLWSSSHDLCLSARSHLSDPLSINNLLCLSANKFGIDIYLINQITSASLTSNNIICDNTFMRLSKVLTSPMGWRLKRPRLREATILSLFQPPGVYKQANFSQIIQYRPCSCLDNISSPRLHLCLLPAILDVLFPVLKTLFPEVLFPEVETLPSSALSVPSQHFVAVIVSLIHAVGLPGRAIGMARCSSLSHTWVVTLPEFVPSLLKKAKVASPLEWALDNFLSCAASRLIPATG